MKILAVLYTPEDWHQDFPKIKPRFVPAYEYWTKFCLERDIKLVRINIGWFDGEKFTKYWIFDGSWQKVDESISPDVIYDKTMLYHEHDHTFNFDHHQLKIKIAKKYPIFNLPEFSLLLNNKLNQYLLFQKLMPTSRYYKHDTVIENHEHKKMVVKPIFGSGGEGIIITSNATINVPAESLVQEFVPSLDGINRDYRIVFIGKKIVYTASRFAKPGSELTNTNQGAEGKLVEQAEIPELIAHAKVVAKKLDLFSHKIFSLDFLLTEGQKPYLIEANSMPGLGIIQEDGIVMQNFFRILTEYLFI